MKIEKTITGKKAIVELEGRLNSSGAPMVDEELKAIADEAEELVLDFDKLEYISSAGLRILLSLEKKMKNKGGMVLKNVKGSVMNVMEVTGFSDILTIK